MKFSIAKRAIELLGVEDSIVIGGGEPTMHSKFWEILGLCIVSNSSGILVITNGKKTNDALRLARLSKAFKDTHMFAAALSSDYFHESVDQDVVDAFRELNNLWRYNSDKYLWVGRAKEELPDPGTEPECCCDDLFVRTNGDVATCGCENANVLGNVADKNASFDTPEWWHEEHCINSALRRRLLE